MMDLKGFIFAIVLVSAANASFLDKMLGKSEEATTKEETTHHAVSKRQIPFLPDGSFMDYAAYDYYDWVCSNGVCQVCDVLTGACCNPRTQANCFLPDSCANNPCLSGGTCISTRTVGNNPDFTCVCQRGLTGKYCQLIDEFTPPLVLPIVAPIGGAAVAPAPAPGAAAAPAPAYGGAAAPAPAAAGYGQAAAAPAAAAPVAPQARPGMPFGGLMGGGMGGMGAGGFGGMGGLGGMAGGMGGMGGMMGGMGGMNPMMGGMGGMGGMNPMMGGMGGMGGMMGGMGGGMGGMGGFGRK